MLIIQLLLLLLISYQLLMLLSYSCRHYGVVKLIKVVMEVLSYTRPSWLQSNRELQIRHERVLNDGGALRRYLIVCIHIEFLGVIVEDGGIMLFRDSIQRSTRHMDWQTITLREASIGFSEPSLSPRKKKYTICTAKLAHNKHTLPLDV